MLPLLAAAIPAGIAAAGSIASGLIGSGNVDRTNAQNERLTREGWARDDNSIQRRVADLKAAGLSPVLAAGQGASTGAPIKMESYKDVPNVGAAAVAGWQGGIEMLRMQQDISRTQAETDRIRAITEAQAMQNRVMPARIQNEMALLGEKVQTQYAQTHKINTEDWLLDTRQAREKLELDNRKRDLELVRRLGGRSDMKSGTMGQLTEALNIILDQMHKLGWNPK